MVIVFMYRAKSRLCYYLTCSASVWYFCYWNKNSHYYALTPAKNWFHSKTTYFHFLTKAKNMVQFVFFMCTGICYTRSSCALYFCIWMFLECVLCVSLYQLSCIQSLLQTTNCFYLLTVTTSLRRIVLVCLFVMDAFTDLCSQLTI